MQENTLERGGGYLKIFPFPDYDYLKNISIAKYLVTTGISSLQKAKIKALKIEKDFIEIVINDPIKSDKSKKELFKELIKKYNLIPEKTYVIGDNSDSEIKTLVENNFEVVKINYDRENKNEELLKELGFPQRFGFPVFVSGNDSPSVKENLTAEQQHTRYPLIIHWTDNGR